MKPFIALTVLFVGGTLFASVPDSIRKGGSCKIQTAKIFEKEKIFRVALSNSEVEVTTELRGDDFLGKFVVNANPEIKNKSGRKLNVSYHVALFNKAGELVGVTTQETDFEPANRTQFGSCLMHLPESELANITSYRIVVYVDLPKSK